METYEKCLNDILLIILTSLTHFLQVTSVNPRTTFTTSTLCALRSETWRPALSCLRLPNPRTQVQSCAPASSNEAVKVSEHLKTNALTLLTTCSRYDLKDHAQCELLQMSLLCCVSQRTMRRTERQTPARADLYATSSPRPSCDWGPWELREWLINTHTPEGKHPHLFTQTMETFIWTSAVITPSTQSSSLSLSLSVYIVQSGWNSQLEIGL